MFDNIITGLDPQKFRPYDRSCVSRDSPKQRRPWPYTTVTHIGPFNAAYISARNATSLKGRVRCSSFVRLRTRTAGYLLPVWPWLRIGGLQSYAARAWTQGSNQWSNRYETTIHDVFCHACFSIYTRTLIYRYRYARFAAVSNTEWASRSNCTWR